MWCCQICVKERKEVGNALKSNTFAWAFKVARLINISLKFIASSPSSESIASLMRFIEVFTSIQSYEDSNQLIQIYDYLIRQNFYADLRRIVDIRIPPMVTETIKAPTPLAETFFNLIMQPLGLIQCDDNVGTQVLLNFTKNFLTERFSEQVDYFVVPALAAEKTFPYALWGKVLQEHELKKTPWLLYSFLRIGKIHLGNEGVSFDVQCYLNVLSDLTGTIMNTHKVACMTSAEDSDSDDDEEKTTDVEMADVEASNIQRSVAMLNNEEVVSSLVAATEKSQNEPMALTALCKLCHNLLLSDPLALHHFRLLYTLAFRPVLLHRLWNLILDTKRQSKALVGSSIPLLTVIDNSDLYL